jgi:hypothetical protein
MQAFNRQARFLSHDFGSELLHMSGEFVEAIRMSSDVVVIDPIVFDQDVSQPVKQCQIALRSNGQMLRRVHRGFGSSRIDDDDFRLPFVAHHPFPQDRVSDADVGSHENHAIGLFKVLVRIRRCVESKRLLIGDDCGRHALASVAVAMNHSHSKLGDRPQQRQFLCGELPRP